MLYALRIIADENIQLPYSVQRWTPSGNVRILKFPDESEAIEFARACIAQEMAQLGEHYEYVVTNEKGRTIWESE